MGIIVIDGFTGMKPALTPHRLPPGAAVECHNADFSMGGIGPLPAPLRVRTVATAVPFPSVNFSAPSWVAQIPTPVYTTQSGSVASLNKVKFRVGTVVWAAATTYFPEMFVTNGGFTYRCLKTHTSTATFATDLANGFWVLSDMPANYTIVANDQLWVLVHIADGTEEGLGSTIGVPGLGCCDLEFTTGQTLGAGAVDQNGLAAISGNLFPYAWAKWYARKINLSGNNASDGTALIGKTLKEFHFWNNTTSSATAHYAMALIWNTATQTVKRWLFLPELESRPWVSTGAAAYPNLIDVDDILVDSKNFDTHPTLGGPYDRVSFVFCDTNDDLPRGRFLATHSGAMGNALASSMIGLSHHNILSVLFGASPSTTFPQFSMSNEMVNVIPTWPVDGWLNAAAPTAAATSLTVGGGTAPTGDRTYIFTHVSEFGMESAPSPPKTANGNTGGTPTWTLTGFPLVQAYTVDPAIAVGRPAKRRVYRADTAGVYRFVAEMLLTDVTLNDQMTDATLALQEECPTIDHGQQKEITHACSWERGILAGIGNGNSVYFTNPYTYQAWENKYNLQYPPMAIASLGDKVAVLTKNKPVVFTGNDPSNLIPVEIEGEACRRRGGANSTPFGVLYEGITGICAITNSGFQNLTDAFYSSSWKQSYGGDNASQLNIAASSDRIIFGYLGGGEQLMIDTKTGTLCKVFVKPNATDAQMNAMSYYAPRDAWWVYSQELYNDGAIKSNYHHDRLFAQPDTGLADCKMPWLHLSGYMQTAEPLAMRILEVRSPDWGKMSEQMANRELWYGRGTVPAWVTATAYAAGNFVTQGGNLYRCLVAHTSGVFVTDLAASKWVFESLTEPYTPFIVGDRMGPQAEWFLYAKVWANADDTGRSVLLFSDFIVNEKPVRIMPNSSAVKSDCWQVQLQGNITVAGYRLATSVKELDRAG